jgi:signal transduction histidine kinase
MAVVVFSAVALVIMWLVVSLPRLYDAIYLRGVTHAMQDAMPRGVKALAAVQAERGQSLLQAGSGAGSSPQLSDLRTQTDQAVRGVRDLVDPVLSQSTPGVREEYKEFTAKLDELPGVRRKIDAKSITRSELYDFYSQLADISINVFDMMVRALPDQPTSYSFTEVHSLFRVSDEMSRSATLVSAAISSGSLNSTEHAQFSRLSGAYRQQLELSSENGSSEVRARYQDLVKSDDWKRLTAAEDRLIGAGAWTVVTSTKRTDGQVAAPPVSDQEWRDITTKVYGEVSQLSALQFAATTKIAADRSSSALTGAIVGSAIALLVGLFTIVGAMRVMRRTAQRLTRLRYETLDLAVEKLPPIVRRLRAGERVDVATELPVLDFGRDEIGQVARAFNAAHATAIEAAVQESQARAGIRNVFLGIAHRSQALVHRQLKILDRLEREEEDPKQLEALFGLDHLATRARRNAENLIILGGQQPGRIWRRPVLLADILRGAIAETTQYKRVRLQGVPRMLLTGTSVGDVMHLVAELLDNATSFSPPQAQVRLYGEPAARGIVVEVEDNGLGMDDLDRDRHNAVLADPPDFDAMALKGDPRLGLFVVARLAARHGIKVELRSSSYGGTRAIVLVPSTLLVDEEQAADEKRSELEDTSVMGPVMGPLPARNGAPAAEFVDDVLPFRVSLQTDPQTATATRVEERPVLDETQPEWPQQEVVESTPDPVEDRNNSKPAEIVDALGRPALPRRRRQASLAPQLKATAFAPDEPEDDLESARSPEEIRGIMSAFQQQSRRARDEDE